MGNKKISLKDKQVVINKLAKGATYRQAMVGTEIKSTQTVGTIAKLKSNDIKQIRAVYLEQIEQFEAGLSDRAKMWAEMSRATKYQDGKLIPDWSNRKEALVYIDKMAGISVENPNINAVQIILSPDVQKFAE